MRSRRHPGGRRSGTLRLAIVAVAVAVVTFAVGIGVASLGRSTPADRADAGPCERPYRSSSPWNTPIGPNPSYHPSSRFHVGALEGTLTSDPTQYTYPVYEVTERTPLQSVEVQGVWSNVTDRGRRTEVEKGGMVRMPIPSNARAAAGTDAQVIILNTGTGAEWGAWRLARRGDGSWTIDNGYHYDTAGNGVPPPAADGNPFGSRGAGVPYLAGLVRPCEIARGRIDHALAFAYDSPSSRYVYPATKSDGLGTDPADLPEGARLQLDPSIPVARIRSWGCAGPCLTIARALQTYGMYVIDNAGRPKVMLEYEDTARWNGAVDAETVSPIPLSAFRLVAGCRPDAASSDPGDALGRCPRRGSGSG